MLQTLFDPIFCCSVSLCLRFLQYRLLLRKILQLRLRVQQSFAPPSLCARDFRGSGSVCYIFASTVLLRFSKIDSLIKRSVAVRSATLKKGTKLKLEV